MRYTRILRQAVPAILMVLPVLTQAAALENPLAGSAGPITSIPQAIGVFIKFIIGFVGSGAMVMFVWGGVKYMLAAGDDKAIGQAKEIMTWAVKGLVVMFFSFAIVNAITSGLTSAGSDSVDTVNQ